MIDAYVWGKVDRISPEAPVPVLSVTSREARLGGAANVALNVLSLGAMPFICSVVGEDRPGEELLDLMDGLGLDTSGIIRSAQRVTTVKTRVIAQDQHLLRVDEEQTSSITNIEEDRLLERINFLINEKRPDVVIFEDYNKGVLTSRIISKAIELFRQAGIPTCVDPKKENFFEYRHVSLFKPNLKELKEGLKLDFDKKDDVSLRNAEKELRNRIANEISLITLSERGVFIRSDKVDGVLPAHIRNIADVSGAGDTVIAVAALCLAAGLDHERLANLSNLAGGLVCEKVGVVPIDKETLIREAGQLEK